MKTPIVAIVALACAGLSSLHGEKAGEAEALKTRTSHAALAKRMAKGDDPLANHGKAKPLAQESIKKKEKRELGGILSRSTILAHGGFWTIVPKGSVLHTPPAYKARLSDKPVGRLLDWKEFYSRNRGWIFTQTVEIANARGEAPFSEEVLKNHKQLGRVVVAVLHQGPISVRAPKPTPPAATPAGRK